MCILLRRWRTILKILILNASTDSNEAYSSIYDLINLYPSELQHNHTFILIYWHFNLLPCLPRKIYYPEIGKDL